MSSINRSQYSKIPLRDLIISKIGYNTMTRHELYKKLLADHSNDYYITENVISGLITKLTRDEIIKNVVSDNKHIIYLSDIGIGAYRIIRDN